MQKIILGTVIAAFGALNVCAAFAQDMTLTSTEVADGATIKEAQGATSSAVWNAPVTVDSLQVGN